MLDNRAIYLLYAVTLGLAVPFVSAGAAPLGPEELDASIVRGARLYDNWYRETGEPVPQQSHPAYPLDGRYADRPGRNWRCSECHGWDYRGRDGAYAKGDHATGIIGIRGMAQTPPAQIVEILENDTHALSGRLDDDDFRDLANFVSLGQVDMGVFIDPDTRTALGNADDFSNHYLTICVNCHGRDGRTMKSIPPIGDVSREDPWNTLHKILNGHPDEEMPALRVLDREVVVGILAFVQTLPTKDVRASLSRGGRLYDDWALETGARLPTVLHPDYPAEKNYAEGAEANWRCVECHGWDYRGREGAASSGESYTGISGIRAYAGADPDRVIALLKNEQHGYGPYLVEEDLVDLANFVSDGQVNMDDFIDRRSLLARGDGERQAPYFRTVCAQCHGKDGLSIRSMPALGEMATKHPWETLHKTLNGHPGEAMPALRGLDPKIVAGILAYAQTLATGDLVASIARGGRLYDNWPKESQVRVPASSHPAYPADSHYAGRAAVNWRCKECHGWDYRGSEGDYGRGKHYTGIKGIRAMDGAKPAAIIAVLRDKTHGYAGLLRESDLQDLANFVSRGQVDMDEYIDRRSRKAKADSDEHKGYYLTICVSCHGPDGAKNLTMPPLGKTGKVNPWEVLHKILNGPPGDSQFHTSNVEEKMPELRALDLEIIVGILAYIQALPADVMVHSY